MPSPERNTLPPQREGQNHRRPSELKYCYYVGGKYKLQSARFRKKTISYQFSNGVTIFFWLFCYVSSWHCFRFHRARQSEHAAVLENLFSFFFPLKKTKRCSLLLLSPTAEAEKTPANLGAESAAPAAAPGSTEDKPKEDVTEPSSSAATDTTVDGKTDDEGVDSKETSVESPKETNVNNSNSHGLSPQRGLHLKLANGRNNFFNLMMLQKYDLFNQMQTRYLWNAREVTGRLIDL